MAVAIWFFGPYIGFGDVRPLAGVWVRLILIGVVFVAWLVMKQVAEHDIWAAYHQSSTFIDPLHRLEITFNTRYR